MRLYEVIDTLSRASNKDSAARLKTYQQKTNIDKLGGGRYSDVFSIPSGKRQNEILKVSKNRSEEHSDPYEIYIESIARLQKAGNQNPYFPRVLSYKSYRDGKGKMHSVSRIERLYSFESPKILDNWELMESIFEDMFIVPPRGGEWVGDVPDFISMAIGGNYSNIADQQLEEACKTIHNILRDWGSEFALDLHEKNIMWRITGNRPQLVITDPLSSSNY